MDPKIDSSRPQSDSVNLREIDPDLNHDKNTTVVASTTEAGSHSDSRTDSSDSQPAIEEAPRSPCADCRRWLAGTNYFEYTKHENGVRPQEKAPTACFDKCVVTALIEECYRALEEYERDVKFEAGSSVIAKAMEDVNASIHHLIRPRSVDKLSQDIPTDRNCATPTEEDLHKLDELLMNYDGQNVDQTGLEEFDRAMKHLISLGFFEMTDSEDLEEEA